MALSIAVPRREARRRSAPVVIAHRGASGHRPEHTLAGYELAFRLGADAIELDLLATRDGAVVCRHDVELSRTTDVAARPEYAHLRRTVEVDGEPVSGWFVHDFTLAELRGLKARERWPRKRPTSASFNDRSPIPTFAEVLDLVSRESGRAGRQLGVYAELKEVGHLVRHDLWLPDLVRGLDRPEVTWMGFNVAALCALDLPERSVRIFDKTPSPRDLAKVGEYAAAVAVRKKAIYPRDSEGRLTARTKVVEKAHKRGLSVLVWSHRAENQYLPTDFRIGGNPHGHGDAVGEAELFLAAGVDGLITDFPELGVAARQAYSAAISSA